MFFYRQYVSYGQITSSLQHAVIDANVNLKLTFIDVTQIVESDLMDMLEQYDGILIPGGELKYGHEMQITAIKFARDNDIAILGICLGMQLMAIEFAKNVLNLEDAGSSEIKNYKNNIIDIVSNYVDCDAYLQNLNDADVKNYVNYDNILVGNYAVHIKSGSMAHDIYQKNEIVEECSNNYVLNAKYMDDFEQNDMKISGFFANINVPAIIEYERHSWFVGVQFHPEFQEISKKLDPIFYSFIKYLIKIKLLLILLAY